MIMLHVNLPGCIAHEVGVISSKLVILENPDASWMFSSSYACSFNHMVSWVFNLVWYFTLLSLVL